MAVTQSTLWLQYLQALSSSVQLESGEALQAIYPFSPWDWGGRDAMTGTTTYQQYAMLDAVPANPTSNQMAAPAPSASGFDVAYQNWFDTLAVGNFMHDSHYQQLQDQLTNANNTYVTDYSNAQNVWTNQTGGNNPTMTFTQWLASPAGFTYNNQLTTDQSNVTAVTAEMSDYRARIQNPIAAIEAAYGNTNYQGNVTDPNSGKSYPVRLWTTVPANPYAYVEEITNGTFGGDAVKGNAVSFTVSSTTDTYDYSSFYAEGGAGIWDDFIGFEAGGSYQSIDWSQFESEYSITFAFQDLVTVTVDPEGWFAGANITSFGQGPYADGFSAFAQAGDNFFFGPGGALSRIYSGLIVGYRPTITVTAGESLTTYLQTKWEEEDGIEIGPFFFGSESSGETESSSVTTSNGSLVLTSTADWPMIVGMKSAWTLAPAAQAAQAAQPAALAGGR